MSADTEVLVILALPLLVIAIAALMYAASRWPGSGLGLDLLGDEPGAIGHVLERLP